MYCEWHRSIARRLGYKNPDSVSLQDFIPGNSALLLAEVALVEAEPSFLISKFSESSIHVEKAADLLKEAVRRSGAPKPTFSLLQQLDQWDRLEGFSENHASPDQLWRIIRMALMIAYSAGRDQIMRLLTSLTCFDNGAKSSFTLGQAKPEIELAALSLLHISCLSDTFKNESSRTGVLSRLTFISEVGMTSQDFSGQILDNSVSFSLRVLSKIPKSLQFLDNFFWFVLAFFPLKCERDKQYMVSNIYEVYFTPQDRSIVYGSESSQSLQHHLSATVAMELLCTQYNFCQDNIYRYFAKFWSVVFCIIEGSFVERNLHSALLSLELDAEKSAPAFIRDSFYRLRLILQSSCGIRHPGSQMEKNVTQLAFDDSDFEAIPLQIQVGLLACRGMMILHNAIAFNSEYANTEAADKAALQFFDRAEQVSRLVTPRVVRIGILFAKAFISFRRCAYFKKEYGILAGSEEPKGGEASTFMSRTSSWQATTESSLLSQHFLCFTEGLKYLKSLCKYVFMSTFVKIS